MVIYLEVTVKDWIKDTLSGKEQYAVFKRKEVNACILASAGSGKTRTLVNLLIKDIIDGVPPEGIICFTFTQKAADELLARIHSLVKKYLPEINLTGLFIGTIHAWCFQYLLKNSNFYNFTPFDELQTFALTSRLYDKLKLKDVYNIHYPFGIEKFLFDLEIFFNEQLSPKQIPQKIKSSIIEYLRILNENRILTFGEYDPTFHRIVENR